MVWRRCPSFLSTMSLTITNMPNARYDLLWCDCARSKFSFKVQIKRIFSVASTSIWSKEALYDFQTSVDLDSQHQCGNVKTKKNLKTNRKGIVAVVASLVWTRLKIFDERRKRNSKILKSWFTIRWMYGRLFRLCSLLRRGATTR